MRSNSIDRHQLFLLGFVVLSGCGGVEGPDKCASVVCNQPPANECKDAQTLTKYESVGSCNPDTGKCEYNPTEQHCDYGCSGNRCLAEDKCRGVVCDAPPDNDCKDENTLLVYPAIGTCVPETGECDYHPTERPCDNGCENRTCKDQDLCEGVICNDPPDNTCKDENTLLEYQAEGNCAPETGRCNYDHTEKPCENGCEVGKCVVENEAWGWITVLESQGVGCHDEWYGEWCGRVRAYFAVEPSYNRSLTHDLDFLCKKEKIEGECVLYNNCVNPGHIPILLTACTNEDGTPCSEDQLCDDGVGCLDHPTHWDLGTITIEGLKQTISMTPDEYNRYHATEAAEDLFDEGDSITVSVGGGELSPFSMAANGVADLEITSPIVELEKGHSATISWTPAASESRIKVVLFKGWHFPFLPWSVVVCDAPDREGKVEIPVNIVDAFVDDPQGFTSMRFSRITRYSRDNQSPFGKDIELIVGSVRGLQLAVQGTP